MDMSLNGERAIIGANAKGVRREGVEFTLKLPGGGLAYFEAIKVPPGDDAALPAATWRRVRFGDGITLLVRVTG